MAKSMRKVLAVLGALVILAALAGTMVGTSSAANLTGGNYTYVINGEESVFSYDPVIRKDGVLLPSEVFQKLGINVDGTLGENITLTKGSDMTDILTVGTTTASLNGAPDLVATAPLRLNGRVFLPADALKDFGVDVTLDQNYVIIRDYTSGVDAAQTYSISDWAKMKEGHWFTSNPRADSTVLLTAEFTFLNANMINSTNLGLTYGMRARLLTLLQTNTLVYVKAYNANMRSGALQTGSIFLIDGQGNQYDTPTVMDIGNGLISSKLAPGATRVGVLVFPKIPNTGSALQVYYDPNNGTLGTFGTPN